jgi:2-haloacid dehalogenase
MTSTPNAMVRIISFDCYGTLIDAAGGRGAFLYGEQLRRDTDQRLPGPALAERWGRLQWEELQTSYRPYKDIVATVNRRLAVGLGWPWSSKDDARFLDATRALQPFGDVVASLAQLKRRGYRLALLSNSDRDLIAHADAQMSHPFDDIFVAEDCRAYKPSGAFFDHAGKMLGASPGEVLHVANGFHYDIPPAKARGWQVAWLNRGAPGPAPEPLADHEWASLAELVGFLDSA